MRLPVVSLPSNSGDLEQFARLWQRESVLLPLALYVDASDGVPEGTSGDSSTAAINRLMTRATGVTFLDAPENWSGLDNDTLTIDVRTPTTRASNVSSGPRCSVPNTRASPPISPPSST